ncbi:MAG: CgeB family protein [Desulfitobacteriaceae bacterium]
MKILCLNDSALLTHGLASGFPNTDELRYLPVHLPDWEAQLPPLIQSWRPKFALAEGVSISTVARKLFRILMSYNLPLVYWAIDDPPDWGRMSLPLSRRASLTLTPAEECLPRYQRAGIKAEFLHFACNPLFHRRVTPDGRFNTDILLVANYYTSYSQRKLGLEILLSPLLTAPYPIQVYGDELWLHNTDNYQLPPGIYQGHLPYTDLPTAYSSAKIVLGLHSVTDSPTMMSMRIFEALGCGAFCLTHYTPAVERYFQNHVHLVWSRHPDETPELVRYYLQREDLRQKIAKQGQEEVYRHHTYTQRVESVRGYLEHL